MAIFATAGAKFYLGTTLAVDFTTYSSALANFAADTYVEVKPMETIGDFGDTSTDVKFLGIGDSRARHLKGSSDAGVQQLIAGFDATDLGQIAVKAAKASPQDFNAKILFNDAPVARSATVTITIASPGVVTWTGHGLAANAAVVLTTTGALPTGLTASTTYYVKTVIDANTFTLSATAGGSVINTTGTQSGVHTLTTVPSGTIAYYRGKVMAFKRVTGTGPDNVIKLQFDFGINSDIIEVPAAE
ncbi:hypothetical protein EN788_22210 [Mesorhizobium sp. M2D.F.Ca.ET.145.01.1.1]|uniref:hypothetical protein n=1 Tax=unclassified Mesorhizobium TaxID=325217 RepID=UPI000FCBE8AF|nr:MULTISPECIES: hypothetical protein [unclassified Mesorhizobium]TGU44633.1 hypothetical protein EN789_21760 [bacterium M00.F.Ca.ET.146.01.1.1]TGU58461.1 hypothetical protein EN791_021760 [Mesorhizobium sp. M2D.F.Ca.ET.148.01.1.1]TGU64393.1 hypothetical protein EN790_21755 [Mesorhizobium sp. M2D.F.Ca.ET.147.01.1.1]TGW09969.1 hypothetical protein EN788_22210 [Mesorhizobium sp. M2D.F.Ca.ET.145.01.1.1]